jgi:hypothetical protein
MANKKNKRRRDLLKSLDLHGLSYNDAERAVIDFVAKEDTPFQIITGNSNAMKKVVIEVLDSYDFYYYFKDWYNLGCLVVTVKRR